MDITVIGQQFVEGMKQTGKWEFLAVVSGIISVWYSRKAHILVYPTGLVNTTIYIYLSFKGGLLGEASVNFYYTIMSLYGWVMWKQRDPDHVPVVQIRFSTAREWINQFLFFGFFYVLIFLALTRLRQDFAPGAIPWADAFASATAFTGMWLMTRKKVESWYWWMATNIASIPLYFVKGYVFTSVYYFILLLMSVWGLWEWHKMAKKSRLPTIQH